ncbi:MAG TPA: HD domain-containing phosphohydrolase [Geobacteraceae bacterium]|nr:HD domain-containing phosphohydrolase [Geobacteraceae bacterium]
MSFKQGGRKMKILILISLVVCIGIFHFLIPTEPHTTHKIHIILRKFYYLPPVMAGAWFGLRGAFYVTLAISILFTLHVFLDWPGNYMEQANQIGELVSFWVVGLIPGYLFDRQRSLMQAIAKANEETLLGLISALDLRESNTRMHSQRVRDYALLLADRLGVGEKERRNISIGALLHDVGKIAVPDRILLKPEGLSETEWQAMRDHPAAGWRIMTRIGFLREAAEIVYSHHEHFDGTGYPRGLKGYEIPLGARIFMVVDVYDALTSSRPYRRPISYDEATMVIRGKSGNHFDPAVVEVFLAIDKAELKAIEERYRDSNDFVENPAMT